MAELSFDIRGNLQPYEKVNLTFQEFKQIFVEEFAPDSSRHTIFENYQRFIDAFAAEVTTNFIQWIDGSFVTNRTNPRDIDVVNFIDFAIYEEKQDKIEQNFRLHGASKLYPRVDAYVVKLYPKNHERYWVTEYDSVYWQNWFSETRKNRANKIYPKGFIELKFSN